jgi:tubulin--tyrosine ligase
METRGEWWICKPSMYEGGQGVTVVRTIEQFTALIERYEGEVREWVVQQYIRPPLLAAGNRKFHIRAYVLCVGNLSVYVYNDMLALFALDPYSEDDDVSDDGDDVSLDASRHLTNTCLSKHNPRFNEADMVFPLTTILPPHTQPLLHSVHAQIAAILADTFECLHSEPAYFQPLPTAFEVFGFDFLVRADGSVFILEANAGPDFGQSGSGAGQSIVSGLMEATARLVVDCAVAQAVQTGSADTSGSGGSAAAGMNLARSSESGVSSGYVQLDDGEGDWEQRKGRFRRCYSRLITQTTSMRYY